MITLVNDFSETVFLGVMDQDHTTIVDRIDPPHSLRITSTIGLREPLIHEALGQIILAHLPEEKCRKLISKFKFQSFTPNAKITTKEIFNSICQSGQQGWAIDDEEFHEGVRSIVAAIFDRESNVVGAVSLSSPKQRVVENRLPEISAGVVATAAAISKGLVYGSRARARGANLNFKRSSQDK